MNLMLLGLKLSIYSSKRFYKKIATLEIELDEDLLNIGEVPGRTRN